MRNTIIILFTILLFLGILFFFPFEEEIRKGFAILAIVAILWITEAIPLSVTAILIPLLGVYMGIFDVKTAFSHFAHPLIFLFFGGFVLAIALSKHGVDKFVAFKIISLSGDRFIVAVLLIMLTTSLLSMWISNTSTTAMMIPLALGILGATQGKLDEKVYTFTLLGIAYAASVGGIGTLVGSPPNGIAAGILNLSFADWLKFGIPVFLILFPLLFFILFVVFRPPIGLKVERARDVTFELTTPRVLVLLIFLLTALAWMFSEQLAHLVGVNKYFDVVIAITSVVLLAILRVIDWKDINKGVSWGTLLLFGGGITLSEIMKKTGTAKFMADWLVNTLSGVSTFVFLLVIVLLVIFMTELMSNTATTALIAPILYATAQTLNKPPEMLIIPAAVAASCAFMLPVATPPNAIVYGTGHIKQRDMMKVGFILNIVFALVLAAFFTLYVGG